MKNPFFILALMLILNSPFLSADALPQASKTPSSIDRYLAKADQKFDKGALNFTSGWTEFFRQPSLYYKKASSRRSALLKASTQGISAGLVHGTLDTGLGFINALTALIPQIEIPLPQGGIQVQNLTGGDPEQAKKNTQERQKMAQLDPLLEHPQEAISKA